MLAILFYLSWLAMLTLHEAGHVLHAWLSGGKVVGLTVPVLGFSQTHVSPNPRPQFVAWGGVIWGSMLPLVLFAVMRWWRVLGRRIAQFFAGFCLIAKRAYLALGWLMNSNDAADLRNLGVPVWLMASMGFAGVAGGLWLWHRLGPGMGLRRPSGAGSVC